MTDEGVLELSSLPARHPLAGEDLLWSFAPRVVLRLALDPTQQPIGTLVRAVTVDWVPHPGTAAPRQSDRVIGWAGLKGIFERCHQVAVTTNPVTITEQAAIGVMALLVHELEGASLQRVLLIGDGPDYMVDVRHGPVAIEVSGIREALTPGQAVQRLREKNDQLLRGYPSGFVSVTAFAHPPGRIVHSFLRFVSRPPNPAGKRKGRARKERPMPPVVDASGDASRAALQGEAALGDGDTALARRKYVEAGDILSRGAAESRDVRTKALSRFLAASHYFRGGDYASAAAHVRKVDPRHLPREVAPRFPRFAAEVGRRSDPAYAARIRAELARTWESGGYDRVIALLRDHQYVLDPPSLSFVRAVLCGKLVDRHYSIAG